MLNIKLFLFNLRHYAGFIITLAVVGLIGGFVVPKLYASPTYSSTATFVFKMTDKDDNETLANVLTQNQADTQMLSTYKEVLSKPSLLNNAVKKLTPAEQAKLAKNGDESATIENEVNSRVFSINVTSRDAALSAKLSNQMYADFKQMVKRLSDRNASLSLLSEATPGTATMNSKSKVYAATAAIGAAALGFFVVLCITLFDSRVRSLSDISARNLHVLGELPSRK